ncbi:MAG: S8 family serine peptidase, partial [Actinomycetota bacterium]|nr:S8 family serine peptidase [Actinomycetota bacterium]
MAVLLLAGAANGGTPPAVPAEIIVGLVPGVSDAEGDRLLEASGARTERKLRRTRAKLARINGATLGGVLERLRSDPRVVYAEPNYRLSALATPNDPSFNQLWGLVNTGQTVDGVTGTPDADIDADAAWNVATGSSSVVVGVTDTGVDFSHPDLAANRWTNPGEMGAGRDTNGIDDDANGYVDDWRGWDWVNNDNNPQDDNDHGTHVSGTIGGVGNNGVGVAGVNWNVRIMALKFLNGAGDGDLADAVEAVRYATAMGARVTNNSWSGGGFSQAMFDAIAEADSRGSLFVAAAGNSAFDNDLLPTYPASYDVPNVIAVAATDQRDGLASFSNTGAASVDLGAPGVNVYSTVRSGGYSWFDGTSMASPHVAGTAALAAAAFPGSTDVGLKSLLLRTTDPKTSLSGSVGTGGRLNAGSALTCAGSPKAWLESPRPGFRARVDQPLTVTVIATNCAASAGVVASATANGAPIALTARGDGLYTGTYVPSGPGPVTVTGTASVGGLSDARSANGTVEDDYELREEPFSWVDATAGGTRLTLGDDASASVSLPFSFRYFGQTFTSVAVSSNGYLVFGPSVAVGYRNTAIPNTGVPNGLVAAYWDDLNPAGAGGVWHRTVGTAPNRRLVVSWVGVRHYTVPGPISFQAVLEEGSNEIVLAYQDTLHDNATYNHGASATVGIESLDGAQGLQFLYNHA